MENEVTRRSFLKRSSLAAATPLLAQSTNPVPSRPNIILIISDQFRWDCLGANGRTPLNLTPHIDAMALEGTNFANAMTPQPVCGPARACLFTGQYATRTGVWRNAIALPTDAVTLAKLLRAAGYTANYIGKWHLAPTVASDPATLGPVPPQYRGGFGDFWEGCNVLERTSHPYEGSIWDAAGREITFTNQYRVDFLTDRVIRFLDSAAREPFFLVISYLEPHYQNDCNCFVAPKGYADRYRNSYVPPDLSFFPGDWRAQLPDYYGCIASVDENVGRLRQELSARRLTDRTVVSFVSDHGCHFRTRNQEYKRSAHESSIHVPLVINGPRFNRSRTVQALVSHLDIAPTLLDVAGLHIPESMQGRSLLPLAEAGDSAGLSSEVFVQISESMTGRALRTSRWTYVVVVPDGISRDSAQQYVEYQLYDLVADPHQLVNLAGRSETREISTTLRDRLRARMADAGEAPAEIHPASLYP